MTRPAAYLNAGCDLWRFEREAQELGYRVIAGIDEAGRGPLAGPVVAAAVVLPPDFNTAGIRDSKRLTPAQRAEICSRIMLEALAVGVGSVEPSVIDEINILHATHLAMRRALEDLKIECDLVLVDGLPVDGLPAASKSIVGGDSKSVSIAAASIVAKVTRDSIMLDCDGQFPEYGFAEHKGYCTRSHLEALDRFGPCPIHRRSFAPVAERIARCRLPGLE